MPPTQEPDREQTLQDVVNDLGVYPLAAFEFVQTGLGHVVHKIHGEMKEEGTNRHVTGQELSRGLRDYAVQQWGMLASTVLKRWNITCTYDFGRIVFALIDAGLMQKTEGDSIEDFRNVFDFRTSFDGVYVIGDVLVGPKKDSK